MSPHTPVVPNASPPILGAEFFQTPSFQLPRPALSKPPSSTPSPKSLAESIATATRTVHARLNKLVISRLFLALPPQTPDPSLYVSGIIHIASIYITFESLWQDILDTHPLSPTSSPHIHHPHHDQDWNNHYYATYNDDTCPSPPADPASCERIVSLLSRLRLPNLMRSDAFRSDIAALTGWPSHMVDEQILAAAATASGTNGRLHEFIQHIKRTVASKPHVLVAYAYIFFMALFSGGRYIRATLEGVGDEFWNKTPSPIRPAMIPCIPTSSSSSSRSAQAQHGQLPILTHQPEEINTKHGTSHHHDSLPFRFLHFATPSDGEDLKSEFKKRLAAFEACLTSSEKNDIVQESVCIFDNMTLLVKQLDVMTNDGNPLPLLGSQQQQATTMTGDDDEGGIMGLPAGLVRSATAVARMLAMPLTSSPLGRRLRDSVSIARERRNKLGGWIRQLDHATVAATVAIRRRSQSSDASDEAMPHPTTTQSKEEVESRRLPKWHPRKFGSDGDLELAASRCPAARNAFKSVSFEKRASLPRHSSPNDANNSSSGGGSGSNMLVGGDGDDNAKSLMLHQAAARRGGPLDFHGNPPPLTSSAIILTVGLGVMLVGYLYMVGRIR